MRGRGKSEMIQIPEFFFDHLMTERNRSMEVVRQIVGEIVSRADDVIHTKFLNEQRVPYASRTLARELVMNATWALAEFDESPVCARPDVPLALPAIDEWAEGVLPVRDPEATGLRIAHAPAPVGNLKPSGLKSAGSRKSPEGLRAQVTPPAQNTKPAAPAPRPPVDGNTRRGATAVRTTIGRPEHHPTEAEIILKTFEEARKKTSMVNKSVTVDADFNIIQIQPPHGLPPSLIVPKIAAKKIVKPCRANSASNRGSRVPSQPKKQDSPKRKVQTRHLEPDVPKFDEELADLSCADKIVCSPGVTFRDGNWVRTRPRLSSASQLTREKYEEYLDEMKRGSE
jgi:hypothetical protein